MPYHAGAMDHRAFFSLPEPQSGQRKKSHQPAQGSTQFFAPIGIGGCKVRAARPTRSAVRPSVAFKQPQTADGKPPSGQAAAGQTQTQLDKAAQPRSSEKNAASRAGQTPCTRWAVTISLLEQKSSVTAENRAFEEKQPLVFFTEIAIHGGVKTSMVRMWSWRRRWGEGSQNSALYDSPDGACGQGKLTFDGRRSGSRARGAPDRALLPAS